MMLIDTPNAVDKWQERYERTRDAFQEKHVYVTRLEMRADELEKKSKGFELKVKAVAKELESQSKKMALLEKRLKRLEHKSADDIDLAQDSVEDKPAAAKAKRKGRGK